MIRIQEFSIILIALWDGSIDREFEFY